MSIFTSSILIPSVDLLLLCAAVRTVWTKTDQSVGILVLWSPPPQYHARLCFGPKNYIILTSGFADITVNWLQTPGSERLSQWPQIEMYFYTYTSFNPSRISVSTSTWLKKKIIIFFLPVEAQQAKVKGQTREFLSAPRFVSSPSEKWPRPHGVADGGGERTEYHTQCY